MPPADLGLALRHGGDPWLTTANLLSMARVPLAGGFCFLLVRGWWWATLGVLALAALTDVLDGRAARVADRRRGYAIRGRGRWLDPLCDKIFIGLVLIAIGVRSGSWRWPLLIFARELVQTPLSLGYAAWPALRVRLDYDFTATVWGKVTTVLQFAAVVSWLVAPHATPAVAVACAGSGVFALGIYLRPVLRAVLRRHPTQ